MISRTPAIFAGITSIKTVEGNATGVPGTHTPTDSMGVYLWPITTPGLSVRMKSLWVWRA